MLVLSRKAGEKVVIGENIVVTILEVTRSYIRIGIEAPGEVPIVRKELLNQQNRAHSPRKGK